MYAVKTALRGTLDEHGLTYRSGFITWSKTAAEQQLQHQHDLERIKIEQNAESSKELIELENFVANEQRKARTFCSALLLGRSSQGKSRDATRDGIDFLQQDDLTSKVQTRTRNQRPASRC